MGIGERLTAAPLGLSMTDVGAVVGCMDAFVVGDPRSDVDGLVPPLTAPMATITDAIPVTIHLVRIDVSGRRHSRTSPGMMQRRNPTTITGHEYSHPR